MNKLKQNLFYSLINRLYKVEYFLEINVATLKLSEYIE